MRSPGTGGRPSLPNVTASLGWKCSSPVASAASLKAMVFGVEAYGSWSTGKRWSGMTFSTLS